MDNINLKNNSLFCKSCTECFTEDIHCPKILPCGHTICKKCYILLLKKTQEENYSCPFCLKSFKKLLINDIPVNYEIISMLNHQRVENSCSIHTHETLIFFCQTDELLICQYCLLSSHIGHKIIKPLDSELSKIVKISDEITETKKILQAYKESIINTNLVTILDKTFQSFFKKFEEIRMTNKYNVVCEYRKLRKFQESLKNFDCSMNLYYENVKIGNKDNGLSDEQYKNEFKVIESEFKKIFEITENLDNYPIFNKLRIFVEKLNKLIDELKLKIDLSILNATKYADIDNILEYLIEDKHIVMRYKTSKVSKDHINLVNNLSNRTEESNEFVVNIMKSVDRADFVPVNSQAIYLDN